MKRLLNQFYFNPLCLLIVFVLMTLLNACHKTTPVVHNNDQCISDSMFQIISVDTIKWRNLVEEIKLNGKISFNEDKVVRMYTPVGGIVEKLNVSLGDYVERGQIMATIRSSEMAGYTSEYKEALSNLKIAKKQMDVTEQLAKTGVASQKDYIEAKENYEIAFTEVNRAKKVVKIFGDSTKEIYYMKSPISGFVVEKAIAQGMTIKPDNDEVALTLSDLKDVWVIANVFEHDLENIKVGDSAEIGTLAFEKPYRGMVSKILKPLDPVTKVAQLRIVLLNPDVRLQPGMYASVKVITENAKHKLPSVSKDAFVFEENKYFLVTYKDTCHMQIINVNPHSIVGKIAFLDPPAPVGSVVISKHQLLVYAKLNRKD